MELVDQAEFFDPTATVVVKLKSFQLVASRGDMLLTPSYR
jgi:hypothetical protein